MLEVDLYYQIRIIFYTILILLFSISSVRALSKRFRQIAAGLIILVLLNFLAIHGPGVLDTLSRSLPASANGLIWVRRTLKISRINDPNYCPGEGYSAARTAALGPIHPALALPRERPQRDPKARIAA